MWWYTQQVRDIQTIPSAGTHTNEWSSIFPPSCDLLLFRRNVSTREQGLSLLNNSDTDFLPSWTFSPPKYLPPSHYSTQGLLLNLEMHSYTLTKQDFYLTQPQSSDARDKASECTSEGDDVHGGWCPEGNVFRGMYQRGKCLGGNCIRGREENHSLPHFSSQSDKLSSNSRWTL